MNPKCKEHDYKIINTNYRYELVGYRNYTFYRTISYFCSRCLDEKEVIKQESGENKPLWFN